LFVKGREAIQPPMGAKGGNEGVRERVVLQRELKDLKSDSAQDLQKMWREKKIRVDRRGRGTGGKHLDTEGPRIGFRKRERLKGSGSRGKSRYNFFRGGGRGALPGRIFNQSPALMNLGGMNDQGMGLLLKLKYLGSRAGKGKGGSRKQLGEGGNHGGGPFVRVRKRGKKFPWGRCKSTQERNRFERSLGKVEKGGG